MYWTRIRQVRGNTFINTVWEKAQLFPKLAQSWRFHLEGRNHQSFVDNQSVTVLTESNVWRYIPECSKWWALFIIFLRTQWLLYKFYVVFKDAFVKNVPCNQLHEGNNFLKISNQCLMSTKWSISFEASHCYQLSSVPRTFRRCLLKSEGCVGS